jgi:hypothetical protein
MYVRAVAMTNGVIPGIRLVAEKKAFVEGILRIEWSTILI